jgi:tRNA1(Val) A37 N6-methylase TrmN6
MVTPEPPLVLSSDSLLGGRVRFRQPTAGYRVNIDSIILAEFARVGRTAGVAVDLGAGVGLVSLLLDHHRAARELVLVEREPHIAALARENLAQARAKVTIHELDVSEPSLTEQLAGSADLVVSNPPFFNPAEHRPPRDAQRERARLGELSPFLIAAAELLAGSKARAAFVYPARSLTELFDAAGRARLVPKGLGFGHAFAGRPARLALVELRRARPGGLVVEPPLIEWLAPQEPSPELSAFTLDSTSDRK